MHRPFKIFPVLPPLAVLLLTGCFGDSTNPGGQNQVAVYAGSQTCAPCHEEIKEIWADSGHPHAMSKVTDTSPVGEYPDLSAFAADPVNPPIPYTWQDVSYVVGGYGWKMIWVNKFGYVITSSFAGDHVMYRFANQTWTTWGAGYEFLNMPANCGQCHATGWQPDSDWSTDDFLLDNQDGLPGVPGLFSAPGIHCEECHGRGSLHVQDPEAHDLVVDRTSADCGRCHVRAEAGTIQGCANFIEPNDQYDEWLHSGHAIRGTVECVDCHDPHASVKHDAQGRGEGTFAPCESCHTEAATTNRHDAFAPTACVDCHMPYAVKTAMRDHLYHADMRTHLVDIETAPVGRGEGMGLEGGYIDILQDASTGLAKITLDFACYGCHQDEDGTGGEAGALSLAELSALAVGIHQLDP